MKERPITAKSELTLVESSDGVAFLFQEQRRELVFLADDGQMFRFMRCNDVRMNEGGGPHYWCPTSIDVGKYVPRMTLVVAVKAVSSHLTHLRAKK